MCRCPGISSSKASSPRDCSSWYGPVKRCCKAVLCLPPFSLYTTSLVAFAYHSSRWRVFENTALPVWKSCSCFALYTAAVVAALATLSAAASCWRMSQMCHRRTVTSDDPQRSSQQQWCTDVSSYYGMDNCAVWRSQSEKHDRIVLRRNRSRLRIGGYSL